MAVKLRDGGTIKSLIKVALSKRRCESPRKAIPCRRSSSSSLRRCARRKGPTRPPRFSKRSCRPFAAAGKRKPSKGRLRISAIFFLMKRRKSSVDGVSSDHVLVFAYHVQVNPTGCGNRETDLNHLFFRLARHCCWNCRPFEPPSVERPFEAAMPALVSAFRENARTNGVMAGKNARSTAARLTCIDQAFRRGRLPGTGSHSGTCTWLRSDGLSCSETPARA